MKPQHLLSTSALCTAAILLPLSMASAADKAAHHSLINLSDSTYKLPEIRRTTDGRGIKVAVLDGLAKRNHSDLRRVQNIRLKNGTYTRDNLHGTHVTGIVAARNDNKGAQGIAPNARVINYGVFDDNGWVRGTSLSALYADAKRRGASIVNESFGVSGTMIGRSNIYSAANSGMLIVKAAGNDGITSGHLNGSTSLDTVTNLLLVGSTNSRGQISNFSNRPGEACLLGTTCAEKDKAKYRFLVAPGERIYSTNERGTYTNMSGTSMAAPVVAGAAAVVQSGWRWLRAEPGKTADILLNSAKDLGAAGVDGVYGYGMVDVEAALRPIGELALTVSSDRPNARRGNLRRADSLLRLSYLQSNGLFSNRDFSKRKLSVFDDYDRDYRITLGDLMTSHQDDYLAFQAQRGRVMARTDAAAKGFAAVPASLSFASVGQDFAADPTATGLNFQLGFGKLDAFANGKADSATASAAALALNAVANPVASYADGGAFARAQFNAGGGLSFSFSSQQALSGNSAVVTDAPSNPLGFARALNADVAYQLSDSFTVSTGFTQLNENDSLLGNSGGGAFSFGEGLKTNAAKFGLSWSPSARFGFDATYVYAHSAAFSGDGVLSSDTGLTSDSWTLRFAGKQLFNARDSIALAVHQPLRTRSGSINLRDTIVTDRDTGAIGYSNEAIDMSAASREINVSLAYAQDFFDGLGSFEVSAGRRFNADHVAGRNDMSVAASFALAF